MSVQTVKAAICGTLLYALLGTVGYMHRDNPAVVRHLNSLCPPICPN